MEPELRPLIGQHHVSAFTANAQKNAHFYVHILGLRLIKKTVNQDDPSMYHLFYGDEIGSPGTDITFFELPYAGQTYRGTNSISRTGLRVPSDEALIYWKNRFEQFGVEHEKIQEIDSKQQLLFEDFEGQRLMLVSDEFDKGIAGGRAWNKGAVPIQYAIYGLGPVELTVEFASETKNLLTKVFGFSLETARKNEAIFSTGAGGNGAEIRIKEDRISEKERPGRGSVHHVALRVESKSELEQWAKRLSAFGYSHSGVVDRYYFQSLYVKDSNGIVFELATDGPGFDTDENRATLGETLALPPFLEKRRQEIEANLKPLQLGGRNDD